MTHLDSPQQLSLDSRTAARHVDRLALQARARRRQRRRRLALDAAFELLLRGRHNAGHHGAPA